MRSIRIFAKNMGDPYYEPTIVVHDHFEKALIEAVFTIVKLHVAQDPSGYLAYKVK